MKRTSPLSLLVSIALSILFIFLGFWQLNRAADLKRVKEVRPEAPAVAIEKLAKPNTNLDGKSANRLAILNGNFVQEFRAPNQEVSIGGVKKKETLEVRLLKLQSGSAILVVRGVQQINNQSLTGEIRVEGRLYPRQSRDVTEIASGSLTRIDPALILGQTNLNLIDGYVVAIKETTAMGEAIATERIAAERQLPKVAGFYWQHITYVGIWWLFALLALLAPFYDRLRDRKVRVR